MAPADITTSNQTSGKMPIVLEFVILGAIAVGCFFAYRVIRSKMPDNPPYKYGVALAVVAAFFLFWVNGAVGIIGSSNNDANMLYLGVVALALLGAVVARFRPAGMALTMFAAAAAQVLVPVVAIVGQIDVTPPEWSGDIVWLTGFFTALWLGAALLFRRAAREPQSD